jgi:hypothetical protein
MVLSSLRPGFLRGVPGLLLAALLTACSSTPPAPPPADAGPDATADGADGGGDLSPDTGADAGADVPTDLAPDGGADAAPDAVADALIDAPADAGEGGAADGFVPAAQQAVVVPDRGGPILDHPRVVIITHADDPDRATRQAAMQAIATSDWLVTVGSEYGVTGGSVQKTVELSGNSPDAVSNQEVQIMLESGIQDGTFPRAPDGSLKNMVYAVYYPAHTTITTDNLVSCDGFGAYHNAGYVDGQPFSFLVIPRCTGAQFGLTDDANDEWSVSHELIEAATDPYPLDPAYTWTFGDRVPQVYAEISELADLCEQQAPVIENGLTLTRVWSNAAAMAGTGDPCVPVPQPAGVYYGTSVNVADAVPDVRPNDHATIHLTAFSEGPAAPWQVELVTYPGYNKFTPRFSLSPSTVQNGETITVTVSVPADAAPFDHASFALRSYRSATDYHDTNLAVTVASPTLP